VSSAPPNYESPSALAAKNIQLQQMYLANENHAYGTVGTFAGSNFVDLQNWYYYLQHYVDTEVGNVLTALQGSTFADNTIVIFTSDHGEYGGSHGLHGKGGAVYDESLRVPLYVMFPGGANTARYQMCSAVDFFKLICELGTGGPTSSFSTNFPDQANRQSIYSFIYSNATETRLGPSGLDNAPYILHTVDEASATEDGNGVYSDSSTTPLKNHVLCLRTKTLESSPDTGAKYAVYSHWALCSTVPASTTPDYEFYDYTNLDNPGELGNNYSSTNPATVALLAAFQAALGPWSGGTPGLIQTELNPALTGTGSDGTTALSTVQSEALIAYKNYIATMLYGEGSDYCGTP
jgi:hypothetical protein